MLHIIDKEVEDFIQKDTSKKYECMQNAELLERI